MAVCINNNSSFAKSRCGNGRLCFRLYVETSLAGRHKRLFESAGLLGAASHRSLSSAAARAVLEESDKAVWGYTLMQLKQKP